MIEAVGFYVPEENDNFDIYVFDENGLIATKTGIVNPPMGYHTFPLDTPAAISAGQDFTIEVRVDGPDSDYTIICAEMPQYGYSSEAVANAYEGFVSIDGEYWTDVNTQFSGTSICLKAYTSDLVTLQLSPVSYSVNKNIGTATLTITKIGSSDKIPCQLQHGEWYSHGWNRLHGEVGRDNVPAIGNDEDDFDRYTRRTGL